MSKIDTTKWGKFALEELFEKIECNKLNYKVSELEKTANEEFNLPALTAGIENQGLSCYVPRKGATILKNCISVSANGANSGAMFYQEKEFTVLQDSYAIRCREKYSNISKYAILYMISVMGKVIKANYDWAEKAGWNKIRNRKIKLPVDINGNPDFAYMEQYMQNLESAVSSSLTALRSAKSLKTCEKVSIASWKSFHLYDIFNIDSGTKLDKAKMDTTASDICFVGRSGINNGITQKVKRIEGLKPYDAGNLTLSLGGAYLGSCFVQEEEFYTSQNVVVLIPKNDISFFAKQFIATTIFRESQNNYKAFIKELNAFVKTTFSIKLPVNNVGEIDYNYMETYMKHKYFTCKSCLNSIKAV